MTLSPQDLEAIRQVVRTEVKGELIVVSQGLQDFRVDVKGLKEQIQRLTTALDNFLKRLTDHEDEFKLLKADVDRIKTVLKEKFGVEILL